MPRSKRGRTNPVNWSAQAIRDAARAGDYGRVVKLARVAASLSQGQLGEGCGMSQSAISRLEGRGAGSYETAQLSRVANHLQIPPHLVGLADHTAAIVARGIETEPMWNGAASSVGSWRSPQRRRFPWHARSKRTQPRPEKRPRFAWPPQHSGDSMARRRRDSSSTRSCHI
ncbi:helix-turn-helix domain-containing protein [Streptomyces sp. 2224.1]|uniref:helix-turn-helix domain-containing protein n=1 Tax=Streptomyces sp. 2224.1 TaxID=1881020 RepID=UPI002109458A|nr:helix-turn-helix transcriptional regulator [Streptomyces sp. 2224.1]